MAISGISTNQIAISLNKANVKTKSGSLWHPLTVRRILLNQTYTGKTYFGQTKRIGKTKVQVQPKETWILLPDVTPPIIIEEIFNKSQEAVKKAKELRPVKPKGSYLLTGFMKCSKCGSTIGGTTLSGKYRYYQCRGAKPTATRDKICDAGYIKADHIENFVWSRISKTAKSPGAVLRALDSIKKDSKENILPILEKKINKLKKSLKFYSVRIPECYEILKTEDEYKDKLLDVINELERKRAEDEVTLKQLQESFKKISQAQQVKIKFTEYCRNVRDAFSDDMDIEKKRGVLRLFQAQVLAEPGHYTLATSIDAEIQSKHNKSLHSSLNYKNLVTTARTSA
jgi:site-specific DNA recombinase